MAPVKSVGSLLDEFSGMGERHYFCLRSGQPCEGWIVAVEEDGVYFLDCESVKEAGQEREPDPIKLRLGAVDLETLEYQDPALDCWVGIRWDETQQRWIETPTNQLSDKPAASATKGLGVTTKTTEAGSDTSPPWSRAMRSTFGQLFQRRTITNDDSSR
jgi:hypothetical protein